MSELIRLVENLTIRSKEFSKHITCEVLLEEYEQPCSYTESHTWDNWKREIVSELISEKGEILHSTSYHHNGVNGEEGDRPLSEQWPNFGEELSKAILMPL